MMVNKQKTAKKTTYTGNGYIIREDKVLKVQYDYLKQEVEKISKEEDDFVLVAHVLVSQIRNELEPVQIHSLLIKEKLRNCKWADLAFENPFGDEEPLLTASGYSNGATSATGVGHCREYSINIKVIDTFIELGNVSFQERLNLPKYNLMTGKITTKKAKHVRTDDSKNALPKMLLDAMDAMPWGLVNVGEVEKHLKVLQKRKEDAEIAWEAAKSRQDPKVVEFQQAYNSALGKFANDSSCFDIVKDQVIEEILPGIWKYTLAYDTQMSGRISHEKGGLQSCSREMKAAAYTSIENFRNYDLKSSQVNGLIQQFEGAGLDTSWLMAYKEEPNSKELFANAMGVSEDCWKECLCALIFGADLTNDPAKKLKQLKVVKSKEDNRNPKLGAILKSITKEISDDLLAIEALTRFITLTKPLKVQLDLWHQWLVTEYLDKVGYYARGQRYIKNPTGTVFNFTKEEKELGDWVKTRLAAFVLQGQEAAFIHALTPLSLKYDFNVISNEHDGLVVIGEIPEAAVKEAAEKSGLKYASLVEKPILSE